MCEFPFFAFYSLLLLSLFIYSATDYKIPKLTFVFIEFLRQYECVLLVCIIYQNDPQLSLINLIIINWHHVIVT